MSKILFLHIPKTSGAALKLFLQREIDGFYIQAHSAEQIERGDPLLGRVRDLAAIERVLATHSGLALHVDSSFDAVRHITDWRSHAHLLFEPRNVPIFESAVILTMVRHPLQRFLSDYAFVRRSQQADPGFVPDLDLGAIEDYMQRINANAMLHFLLEPDFSRPRQLAAADLERVQERVLAYPIHVGIFERYAESIASFARALGRGFSAADIPLTNVGADVPEAPPGFEERFRERNALDYAFYDFACRLFDEREAAAAAPR